MAEATTNAPSPRLAQEIGGLRADLLRYNGPGLRSLADAAVVAIGDLERGGPGGPRITALGEAVRALAEELVSHLFKEDRLLIGPALRGERPSLLLPFLVRVMDLEHAALERLADRVAALTDGFTPHRSTSPAERGLYRELAELDGLLTEHLALARDGLFPALMALLEAASSERGGRAARGRVVFGDGSGGRAAV